MKHKIGIFHLTMIGLSGAIGSGWLLASMYAAKKAGTGAIMAWIIGALVMLVFCMCLSELVSLYPKRGLLASVCSYSHNKDFAFIVSIANWFGTVAIIPSEAIATVRYLNWSHWTVLLLIIMYAILNHWGVKLFAKFNSTITVFKFIVPTLTVIALFSNGVHPHNFHVAQLTHWHAIFSAVVATGIVYSFNGVQMIVNYTGEAKNPKRTIPLALFLALTLVLILYVALQAAFINSANAYFNYNSPFIELAVTLNMGWLVMLLKADAAISPSGAGFSYLGSSSRMLTAMSREKQLPQFFNVLHPKYHISHRSLVANTLLSLLLFGIFRSWTSLVLVVSTFNVISYLSAPLAVGRLRRTMPDVERLFTLPAHGLLCPLLFVALSLLFVLTGTENTIAITIICLIFQAIYLLLNYQGKAFVAALARSAFFPLWLILLTILAYYNINVEIVVVIALTLYYVGIRR